VDSFEEIGVAPELTDALAAEGIERPTPLQQAAIPVLRQGNNLVLAAGPGSGLLVSWCAALLERVGSEGHAPRIVVLTASREAAERLGECAARLASATGHVVAALGSPWVLPERSHLILGTPSDMLAAVAAGTLTLAEARAVVVDQAQLIEAVEGLGSVERVIDYLPADAQRVLSALPLTPAVADLVARHIRRAVTLPPPEALGPPSRGEVRFRIVPDPREVAALGLVAELLEADARHVLIYTRSEDRAADLGDYLTLHGFVAGAPGEPDAPVWLGVDALEARAAADGVEGVVVVSCDVPADPDTLDRRHSITEGGVVLVLPREVPHLKALGRQTGYTTVPFPPPPGSAPTAVDELRGQIERALETEDTGAYLVALAPLFERHDPAEVAAAAVALLRKKAPSVATPSGPRAPARGSTAAGATPAWAKLFVGVGERDGLRPGDLLGAITGEAGVAGEAVGKIEIKESHTLVEVHDAVAQRVIKALNGTTIKGRAVRADFDRPRKGGPPRSGPPRRTGARP
jgi:ATP-dependent RNA helicase DeaD